MKKDLFQIGRCLAPHGIKGGFRFLLENTEESVLKKGFLVYIKRKGQNDFEEHKIKTITFGHRVIAYLEGITNRNQVEEILPFDIYMREEDLPREDDEIYLRDLIGLELKSFDSGESIGKIDKIYSNGIQDIVVYKTLQNERRELPLVDQFFPEIDLEKGVVIVNEPEYIE